MRGIHHVRAGMTLTIALASWALAMHGPALGQTAPSPCRQSERSRALDFWVGHWRVELANGDLAGTNRITRILGGCAIEEDWESSQSLQGRSLFAYDARADEWTQTWVTGDTSVPWGLKRKTLIDFGDGRATFQGTSEGPQGSYLDRTTLTLQADGSVRQVIEISTDQGGTWRSTFDAMYRRIPSGD